MNERKAFNKGVQMGRVEGFFIGTFIVILIVVIYNAV